MRQPIILLVGLSAVSVGLLYACGSAHPQDRGWYYDNRGWQYRGAPTMPVMPPPPRNPQYSYPVPRVQPDYLREFHRYGGYDRTPRYDQWGYPR